MGKIVKQLDFLGDRDTVQLAVLLDSGAGSSIIRRDVAEKLSEYFHQLKVPRIFKGVNGLEALRGSEACTLEVEMKGKILDGLFYVVDVMPREVIIGVDFMQKWEIKLNLKGEDYEVGIDPQSIEIA